MWTVLRKTETSISMVRQSREGIQTHFFQAQFVDSPNMPLKIPLLRCSIGTQCALEGPLPSTLIRTAEAGASNITNLE
ncbi:hypothetical protein E2C01_047155 [Portunus trituberculatus]|uniref:Uncharacterized protein n=1 Tax=Portunus trituberculatus TaxID=210409 RepID=A0A5B7G700_PORTR|nr:hypothetical protein [Portunus trituberculatus]